MQKPEAAEVKGRSANDSEGLQSGFSLDRMREIKQKEGLGREAISGQHRRKNSRLLQWWLWGPYSKHRPLKDSGP